WKLFSAGLRHPREEENHREWWILWRRAAGGLAGPRQEVLFEQVAAHLLPGQKRRNVPAEATRPGVLQEMWRLAATLEWIDPSEKVKLGEALLSTVSPSTAPPYAFWALARLGARQPVGGTVAH